MTAMDTNAVNTAYTPSIVKLLDGFVMLRNKIYENVSGRGADNQISLAKKIKKVEQDTRLELRFSTR